MIINCNKCNKSFNVEDKLIPANGRLLECGNCQYKWFYSIKVKSESDKIYQDTNIENQKIEKKQKSSNKVKQDINSSKSKINSEHKKERNKNILGKLLIIVITFMSIILILDTFKEDLSIILPGINPMLNNFYETLYDLQLFLKDLFY